MRFLLVIAVMAFAVPVGATLADQVVPELDDGVYVEGLSADEEDGIEDAVAEAREAEVDLSVVVLDGDADAEDAAAEILEDVGGGTVLVITDVDYWVATDEFSDDRVQDVIEDSPALGTFDTVAGVEEFVGAATDEGFNWSPFVLAGLIIGVVLAIVGRSWRAWSTRSRRRKAAEAHKTKLKAKVDAISDRILELSVPVQLAEEGELTTRFADATDRYREASTQLDGEVEASKLDAIDATLTSVEEDLDAMETVVDPSTQGAPDDPA